MSRFPIRQLDAFSRFVALAMPRAGGEPDQPDPAPIQPSEPGEPTVPIRHRPPPWPGPPDAASVTHEKGRSSLIALFHA